MLTCTKTQGPVLSRSTMASYMLGWRIILLLLWTNYSMETKFDKILGLNIFEADGYIQHLFLVFHFFPALSKLYNHGSAVSPCIFFFFLSFLRCLQIFDSDT